MSHLETLDRFIKILQRAWTTAGPAAVSPGWERKILAEVQSLGQARGVGKLDYTAPIFLRFSLAALALSIVVIGSYQFSFIEERITAYQLAQLDPFDISGDLYE